MKLHLTLPFLILSACGAQPAPQMFGAVRTDVSRDGRSYTVFHRDNRVEVIRLGYARRGEHEAIRDTMIALVPEVTGCAILPESVQGDSGDMRARLRCP